ncbi:MAG: DUF5688 family protein [Lachnospiraceae bacterium]
MTYEEFKEQITLELPLHFPQGTHITFHFISHNNHTSEEGLTILEPGFNISPTIYLTSFYEKLIAGMPFSELLEEMIHYYRKHLPVKNFDTSSFLNFETIRSRIVYKLVHYEKNKELLQEVPYIPYLDLAIVFYCLISKSQYENATILIRLEHLSYWNISIDTLMTLAKQNTPFLLSFCCDSLSELLLPLITQLPETEQLETQEMLSATPTAPMYVLTNQQRLNGACCILYEGVLADMANRLNSSLYILPSSIHEVIIIPADAATNPNSLTQMVQDINNTSVLPEEVLSDHIYYYNKESQQLSS